MADEPQQPHHTATLAARLDERAKTAFRRLDKQDQRHDDHEARIRSLETWKAWVLGAAFIVTVVVNFGLYLFRGWLLE